MPTSDVFKREEHIFCVGISSLYNLIRDKCFFLSFFKNAVFESVMSLFQLDQQVDISFHLTEVIALS